MHRTCFAILFFTAACSNVDEQRINSNTSNPTLSQKATVIDSTQTNSAIHLEPSLRADTITYKSNSKLEVSEVLARNDTLSIVSGSELISYPMGKFATAQKFLERYEGFSLTFKDEDPDSTGMVRVYTFKKNQSIIKLFKPKEGSFLETASGRIVDKDIILATGAKIGIDQLSFLSIFFTKPISLKSHFIKTVAVYYVVDGEIQYYNFSNGSLSEIILSSNFTVQ